MQQTIIAVSNPDTGQIVITEEPGSNGSRLFECFSLAEFGIERLGRSSEAPGSGYITIPGQVSSSADTSGIPGIWCQGIGWCDGHCL